MEKSRIRKLLKRCKEGKQLAYIDGRYGIEKSIHNKFDWRFYVGNTPYVQCVLGQITACSPMAEKYELFLKEVWKNLSKLSYVVRDRQTGVEFEYFETLEKAQKCMKKFVADDKKSGIYEPRFYEIYNMETNEMEEMSE